MEIISVVLSIFFVTACDKISHGKVEVKDRQEVSIGRLICGGHLPLAVVEKKYQDDLTTFRLKTVQNHDWNEVMKILKPAGYQVLLFFHPWL